MCNVLNEYRRGHNWKRLLGVIYPAVLIAMSELILHSDYILDLLSKLAIAIIIFEIKYTYIDAINYVIMMCN